MGSLYCHVGGTAEMSEAVYSFIRWAINKIGAAIYRFGEHHEIVISKRLRICQQAASRASQGGERIAYENSFRL